MGAPYVIAQCCHIQQHERKENAKHDDALKRSFIGNETHNSSSLFINYSYNDKGAYHKHEEVENHHLQHIRYLDPPTSRPGVLMKQVMNHIS